MALRTVNTKNVVREIFTNIDPEILDGTCKNNKTLKPARHAPPPPSPQSPSPKEIVNRKSNLSKKKTLEKTSPVKNVEVINHRPIKEKLSKDKLLPQKSKTKETIKPETNQSLHNDNNQALVETKSAPSAPPRKRSGNKQPIVITAPASDITVSEPSTTKVLYEPTNISLNDSTNNTESSYDDATKDNSTYESYETIKVISYDDMDNNNATPFYQLKNETNKTILRIVNDDKHKLKIKNEFSIGPIVSNEKKTSILISGDDCYSTVNVNDDVPLYQSSVVVNDANVNQIEIKYNKSSTIYITSDDNHGKATVENKEINDYITMNVKEQEEQLEEDYEVYNHQKSSTLQNEYDAKQEQIINTAVESRNESNSSKRPSSDYLKKLLNDPVEAVRMNLVPHVCGKSDVFKKETIDQDSLYDLLNSDILTKLQLLSSNDNTKDDLSDSYATQYETMDHGSDCYTDNSNRSSITEEELANRTKFYDLLSDTVPIEVSDGDDHHYESINKVVDPIYEEIEIPPPLPANPPPPTVLDDLQIDKELTTR